MVLSEREAAVYQWVDAGWNRGEVELADQVYAGSYVMHVSGQEVRGREALKQFVRSWRTAFPDLHFVVEDLLGSGEKISWRFTARGTQRGEIMGVPPTGRAIEISGIVISRFVNGEWSEDWAVVDFLGLMQQLGAVPAGGQSQA